VVDRLAAAHVSDSLAIELGVDVVAHPHRLDDDGTVWTLLRSARTLSDVTPGSVVVVIGTHAGRWLGRVLAWDFEVNADDPIVTVDLLSVGPEASSVRSIPSAQAWPSGSAVTSWSQTRWDGPVLRTRVEQPWLQKCPLTSPF
jgi:hypothetical protein